MRTRTLAFAALLLASAQMIGSPAMAVPGTGKGGGSGRTPAFELGVGLGGGKAAPSPLLGATGLGQLAAAGAGAVLLWRRRRNSRKLPKS